MVDNRFLNVAVYAHAHVLWHLKKTKNKKV